MVLDVIELLNAPSDLDRAFWYGSWLIQRSASLNRKINLKMNLRILSGAVLAGVLTLGSIGASANTIYGNALLPRDYASDYPEFYYGNTPNPANILVLNSVALPAGHLNSFLAYDRVSPGLSLNGGSGNHTFVGLILRANGGNYDVVYSTGILTVPTLVSDAIVSYPASFSLQAGDRFGFYGEGIPITLGGGTDELYYPTSGPTPSTGDTLTLGSGSFPLLTTDRTYSFAVSVPDGGSTCSLLGLGLAGIGFLRRKLTV